MTNARYKVEEELREWLLKAERVVAAGIGNPIRTDDFVGTRIVQDLQGKVSEKVYIIECETVPENFTQQIVDFNPTHILLIDAAVLGLEPGDSRLIKPERLATFPAFSTHALPLRIFCEYLAQSTKAKIALLLIEPKSADFGEGLTAEIEASAQKIVSALLRVLP
jgi:hydrogenase 3 maturation protease